MDIFARMDALQASEEDEDLSNLDYNNLKMEDCDKDMMDIFEPNMNELVSNEKLLIDDTDIL